MKFIVDTQLPPRLATYLTEKGYESIHTTDFKEGHLLGDDEIILIAEDQDRTVVTKDSDFSEYFLLRGSPPKVLLVEFGNIRNAE
jgi:predicted nuclease of predicted toxin-antitoxin system